MKGIIFVLITLMVSLSTRSQTIQRMGAEVQYGFIIPHSNDLKMFSDHRPAGMHFSWQLMDTSRSHWEVCNCFYYLGARLSYINFGDRDVLGDAFSLAGTYEPVLWRKGDWSVNLHSGIGVTYLTRRNDPETNPTNLFFSTPVSFLLFVAPVVEYRISEAWSAQLSLNYNHISNGGQQQPNHGMNFPQIGVGLNHSSGLVPVQQYPVKEPEFIWRFWLEGGVTASRGTANKRKPSVSLVAGGRRSVSTINALGGGVEVNRDYSLQKASGGNGQTISAPFIAHHFLLGRVDFSQRMALYVHQPEVFSAHRFYQRYVLFFNLWPGFQVGASLKAHAHVAVNLDLRLGWQF